MSNIIKNQLIYQQERELTCMHIYGVGTNGNLGSSVQLLMNKRFNESKPKMGGRSFERTTMPATVNAKVNDTRITMDSNRVSKIQRPFITVDTEIVDVWADVTDKVDHVSFLPDNRPKMTYTYSLNNEEIKGLIDAGLYHNPRFEGLLKSLMESEQFEITKDVEMQRLDVMQDNRVTPVILVQDIGLVQQSLESHEDEHYTSFDYALERAIDMALQLEAEGISTSALIGEDELNVAQEIEVQIDDIFDDELARQQSSEQIDQEIMRQLQEMDTEIDVSDAIDHTKLFGRTSEEERIVQLRDATDRGVEWDEVDDQDEFDKFDNQFGDDIDEDDLGFDDMFGEDLVLEDTQANEVNISEFEEDEDEDELEF